MGSSIGGITGTADPRRLVLWRFRESAQAFISDYNAGWKEPRRLVLDVNENLAEARYLSSFNLDDPSFPAEVMSKPLEGGNPRVVIQGGDHQLPVCNGSIDVVLLRTDR
jgi:hypothetical protein